MKFKDIVNRQHVNLTNCEHEPIHIPGSIQPHGFLLGLDCGSLEIIYCSENTDSYLELPYHTLLGKAFAEVFGEYNAAQVHGYIKEKKFSSPLRLTLAGKDFHCSIHESESTCVFEAEPAEEEIIDSVELYDQTLELLSYMNNITSLQDLCSQVAQGIQKITAYDRVMIYRFDNEYNGEVFAESCVDNVEPFLGLHYPHTDIPLQARLLYIRNLLRLISDINYVPVPLYTIDDGKDKNLDLSLSTLRSTSPIHVQYLKNMGVGATLTISLMHRDRLWGLIACHHYSAKVLSPDLLRAVQLKGLFLTSQIDVRMSTEEYNITQKVNAALANLNSSNFPPTEQSFQNIIQSEDLLKVCNASGVSFLINGKIYTGGTTPSDSEIKVLTEWLSEHKEKMFYSEKISEFVPGFESKSETVSGILYYPLVNDNSVIWYRKETISEIHWGGDPKKAIVKDENGLHPRNSFKLWKEIVKYKSNEWLKPELLAAANYVHTLEKQISIYTAGVEEEKFRTLNNVLTQTNAELENINWISAHDLQEPLRKIQILSSRLLEQQEVLGSENVSNTVTRMNHSAKRMQTLLTDIMKYTRIKNSKEAFEKVDLNVILDDIRKDMYDHITETHSTINSAKLPSVYGIPFLIKQLFSNLILNSIKYSVPERLCIIDISVEYKKSESSEILGVEIIFSDNGIGFEDQYSESIFKIFTRLHNTNNYEGSGIGLALCKKIMSTHNGGITASGELGKGAKFKLFFPNDAIAG